MGEQRGRVDIDEGIVFGTGGGRELRCDVYTPPEPAPRAPGVLLLHGGGWRSGDRTQLRGYGIRLGMAGYVCVAAEYRLADEAAWPAQIHDTKAAIRWMRAEADALGVDPERIAAQGNSAGGHLALLAAGTVGDADFEGEGGNPGVPTDLAAVVAFYPPVRLPRVPTELFAAPGELEDRPADTAAARRASPLTHVDAGFPPTQLLHGADDDLVPVGASLELHAALRELDVPVELHVYARQAHAFDAQPELGRHCAGAVASFLDRFVARPTAVTA